MGWRWVRVRVRVTVRVRIMRLSGAGFVSWLSVGMEAGVMDGAKNLMTASSFMIDVIDV